MLWLLGKNDHVLRFVPDVVLGSGGLRKQHFPLQWLRYSWRNVNKYNSLMQFCAKIEPNYKLGSVCYVRITIFFTSKRKKITHILAQTMSKSMLQLFLRHENKPVSYAFFYIFAGWKKLSIVLCLWCLEWYLSFCHFPPSSPPSF